MATIAKNNQKSIEQFIYRKQYDLVYYPKDYTNIINFWNQSLLYGKIDNNQDSIMLDTANLKLLKTNTITQNKQFYALSFVADAFNEFILEVQRADQARVIPKSKLNPIKVTKASIVPQTNYKDTINKFFDSVFSKNKLRNQITNLNDFLNEFCFFMMNTSLYVTQTAFITNNISSPTITGLVIELSDLKHDEDEPKAINYLEDPNYQFFINTAEKYSFFVDKNAPWRMVFNLGTSYALQKFKNYNFNSLDEVFANAYKPTYLTDWKILRDLLLQYYTDYVLVKPKIQIVELCGNDSITQKTITKENLDNVYGDLFWIKLYYYVRLREEDIRINQNEFENRMRKMVSIYNVGGEMEALKYINKDTKPFLDGGTNPSYAQVIEVHKNKKARTSNFIYKF